jgi:hypothetical protein
MKYQRLASKEHCKPHALWPSIHSLGNDNVIRLAQQAVFIEENGVVYKPGNIRSLMFIVNREFFIFSLFPVCIRSPWRFAADHEHDTTATPVWKDDATAYLKSVSKMH